MEQVSPFESLLQIASAYTLSRCLHVIADLGVADLLDGTPRTASELAAASGANPDALDRVLRFLSDHGVFEMQGGAYRHSPTSQLLRGDHPYSMRAFVRMIGSPINWRSYEELDHALCTGRPALEKVLPDGMWSYYREHPEWASVFNEAMAAKARSQVAAVLAAYDFSAFDRIGDIGGGHGHLLRAVLDAAPRARGVLFDLPHVIEEAEQWASERLTFQAGDFFKDSLPVCDAYLVMEIIHDWRDEEATAILRAIRQSAPSGAKLLLIEGIIPSDSGPHWLKTLDIHMMTLHGGRQRSQTEYQTLCERAGFALRRTIKTGTDIAILEAVPVETPATQSMTA